MASKYLDYDGLEHLIDLIKNAIASSAPTIKADDVTVTVADDGTISIKGLGVGTSQLANASVTTAKLADKSVTADKLADGAVTIEQLDTSSITPGAIGAAAASHNHSADDVTSGTLPVARGGTGVTTDDALFQKVVSSHYPTNEELLAYLGLS